jgi:hypothetical protein
MTGKEPEQLVAVQEAPSALLTVECVGVASDFGFLAENINRMVSDWRLRTDQERQDRWVLPLDEITVYKLGNLPEAMPDIYLFLPPDTSNAEVCLVYDPEMDREHLVIIYGLPDGTSIYQAVYVDKEDEYGIKGAMTIALKKAEGRETRYREDGEVDGYSGALALVVGQDGEVIRDGSFVVDSAFVFVGMSGNMGGISGTMIFKAQAR